jgi:hypothetical protein
MKSFFYILIISFFTLSCSDHKNQTVNYEKIADKITIETAKNLKEEKNLFLIGIGGRMMHDIQMMGMSFNYYQKVDLSSARKLLVEAVETYLSNINNNQNIKPFLHEYPFTAKNVEVRIFIYEPDRSELPPEDIYRISSRNGILRYYNRLDRDNPICKQTFEEASKKIDSEENNGT